jgi:hypothetical protein
MTAQVAATYQTLDAGNHEGDHALVDVLRVLFNCVIFGWANYQRYLEAAGQAIEVLNEPDYFMQAISKLKSDIG